MCKKDTQVSLLIKNVVQLGGYSMLCVKKTLKCLLIKNVVQLGGYSMLCVKKKTPKCLC